MGDFFEILKSVNDPVLVALFTGLAIAVKKLLSRQEKFEKDLITIDRRLLHLESQQKAIEQLARDTARQQMQLHEIDVKIARIITMIGIIEVNQNGKSGGDR
jgi:hypothetical protein